MYVGQSQLLSEVSRVRSSTQDLEQRSTFSEGTTAVPSILFNSHAIEQGLPDT